jgi:hypothetical protein
MVEIVQLDRSTFVGTENGFELLFKHFSHIVDPLLVLRGKIA